MSFMWCSVQEWPVWSHSGPWVTSPSPLHAPSHIQLFSNQHQLLPQLSHQHQSLVPSQLPPSRPDHPSHDSCPSLASIATFITVASPVTGPHYTCLTEFYLSCFYSFYISFLAAGAPASVAAASSAPIHNCVSSRTSLTSSNDSCLTSCHHSCLSQFLLCWLSYTSNSSQLSQPLIPAPILAASF